MTVINESLYLRKKGSVINKVLNVALAAVALILCAEIVFCIFYRGIYVVHNSMYPTLNGAESRTSAGGDYIYVNVYAKPSYGDIVVMYDGNKNIVKRLIAFGGDTVKIEEGKLYIMYCGDSEYTEISEPYVASENNTAVGNVYYNYSAHTVAENCVFLMGDNRNVSLDSREYGDYPVKNLVGVMPKWSLKYKSLITAVHTFFNFTLPRAFGVR